MVAEVRIELTIPFGCVMSALSVPWLVPAIKLLVQCITPLQISIGVSKIWRHVVAHQTIEDFELLVEGIGQSTLYHTHKMVGAEGFAPPLT